MHWDRVDKSTGWPNKRSTRQSNGKLQWLREQASIHTGDDCLCSPFPRATGGYAGTNMTWLACEMQNGPRPDGHVAAHSCVNGHLGCVTPKHLRWATPLENAIERLEHAYQAKARGEVPRYKVELTPDRVREIRTRAETLAEYARRFGVNYQTVYQAANRITWKHVA